MPTLGAQLRNTIIVLLSQYFITLPLAMHAAGLSRTAYAAVLIVNTVMVTTLQVPLAQLTKSADPWLMLTAGALLLGVGFGANLWISAAAGYAATAAVRTADRCAVLLVGVQQQR